MSRPLSIHQLLNDTEQEGTNHSPYIGSIKDLPKEHDITVPPYIPGPGHRTPPSYYASTHNPINMRNENLALPSVPVYEPNCTFQMPITAIQALPIPTNHTNQPSPPCFKTSPDNFPTFASCTPTPPYTSTLIPRSIPKRKPSAAPNQAPWRKRRRSKACVYCHKKKIKCEGTGPSCINCIENGIQCQWLKGKKRGPKPKNKTTLDQKQAPTQYSPAFSPSSTASPFVASYFQTPLYQPYDQSKHTPTSPLQPRAYTEYSAPRSTLASSESSPVQKESRSPYFGFSPKMQITSPIIDNTTSLANSLFRSKLQVFQDLAKMDIETRDAVMYYFNYFYPMYPLFHPRSFLERIVKGKVDSILMDTLKVVTARIITKKTGRFIDSQKIAENVNGRLFMNMNNPTLDYVRAIILMAGYYAGQNDFTIHSSLSCLAMSLIIRLKWHLQDIDGNPKRGRSWGEYLEYEIKRRTFWLAHLNDNYQSTLSDRPPTLSEDHIHIFKPCSIPEWADITVPELGSYGSEKRAAFTKQDIVATADPTYLLSAEYKYGELVARINKFLWNARVLPIKEGKMHSQITGNHPINRRSSFSDPASMSVIDAQGGISNNPIRNIKSTSYVNSDTWPCLSEFKEFHDLKSSILAWKDSLLDLSDFGDDVHELSDIAQFGSLLHRRYMMRLRYFCLHSYFVIIFVQLCQSDRRSLFTDKITATDAKSTFDEVRNTSSIENKVLSEMTNGSFSNTFNQGLVAYDVEENSWQACLDAVFGLYNMFVDSKDKVPTERLDQIVVFALFVSITVLIRHIRKCRVRIYSANTAGALLPGYRYADISKCIHIAKEFWTMLEKFGDVWEIKGMEELLHEMQIEEIVYTANQFSSLKL